MSRLLLSLALAISFGCSSKKESEEDKIRKVLDEGVAALEARDSAKAADTLDDGYRDERGRDKKKLKQLAFFALQQGPVLVSMQNVIIEVNGDAATVKTTVLAVQGGSEFKSAKDLLPTNATSMDLDIKMVKTDGDWKVATIDGIRGPSF